MNSWTNALSAAVSDMLAEIDSFDHPGNPHGFWREVVAAHTEVLSTHGFDLFKRSVNQFYFQFLPTRADDRQLRSLLSWWAPRSSLLPFQLARQIPVGWPGSADEAAICGFFTGLLYAQTQAVDVFGILPQLAEPEIGTPISWQVDGRAVSEDLLNSLRELYSLIDGLDGSALTGLQQQRPWFIEIGAGYGRFAWMARRIFHARYVIVDIPPALFVSQTYLQRCFPDARIAPFQRGRTAAEIRAALDQADFIFLTPNQITLLPDQTLEFGVAISSLHEMRPEAIRFYLDQLTRLVRRRIYLKQWNALYHRDGNVVLQATEPYDFVNRREDYLAGSPFTLRYDRPDAVDPWLFERLFTAQP